MAGVKKRMARYQYPRQEVWIDREEVKTGTRMDIREGFEKMRSLVRGKIYKRNQDHRCAKTGIQLLAFFFLNFKNPICSF